VIEGKAHTTHVVFVPAEAKVFIVMGFCPTAKLKEYGPAIEASLKSFKPGS